MSNESIKPIHTPCKKCSFAIYDGITQTGCCVGYIDAYKKLGVEILEAYDEDKEFYVINDKKCLGYREDKWFDQFGDNLSTQDKIDIYNQKNHLSYVMVINLSSITIDVLDKIFKEVSELQIKPEKIIVVRYRSEESFISYKNIEDIIKTHNIGCSWRIQSMVDDSMNYEQVLQHISVHHRQYRFILSVIDYTEKLSNIIIMANNIVHKELGQFIVISDINKKAIIYGGSVYRFGLSNNLNILDDHNNYIIV